MKNVKFQHGDLINLKGVILEVKDSADGFCDGCFGRGKISICKKLPNCAWIIFRKLNHFEVRKVKKTNKIIIDL